jgi:outer membrane protein assembly factor BamB
VGRWVMEPLAAGDPQQAGPYRLRARLGTGGMGQVFLGYSPAGRAVAVKLIHRELARDGHRLWSTPLGGAVNSGIATAAGVVFVGANDNQVHALRAGDGRRPWHFSTGGSVASGVAVADGIVCAGGNDFVVHALRAANGHPVWAFNADGPVESQIVAAGRVAFVGSNGGQAYALTR